MTVAHYINILTRQDIVEDLNRVVEKEAEAK